MSKQLNVLIIEQARTLIADKPVDEPIESTSKERDTDGDFDKRFPDDPVVSWGEWKKRRDVFA
jgi:hypothetical protein